MPTKTATRTLDDLQRQIAKLQRQNDELVDAKLELEAQLESVTENEQETEEYQQRRTDRARQALVDHHDEAGHRGSQRFCFEAPCPAFNSLLDDGDL
jgi:predicted RNase H-like nuclease (RuvC/YqgF family)